MSKFKFKLNRAGVRELLQSAEMQNLLERKAAEIQGRCGEGFAHDLRVGKNRANAMVWADTRDARRDNSENNTILKAVRG